MKQPVKKLAKQREIEVGSQEEAEYLKKLESDIMTLNTDYVKYIKDNKDSFDPMASNLQMYQKMYYMHMFESCLEPLENGVSASSIVQVIGMYAGMKLVDKQFDKEVKASVSNALIPAIEKKADKEGPNSVWAKRLEKAKLQVNYGRETLTPDTAALTQIGFLRKAYDDMRKPGADMYKVLENYDEAVKTLHMQAKVDGIDINDMNQALRFQVGKIIEKHPEQALFFGEINVEGIKQSDYKTEIYKVNTGNGFEMRERQVWSGEFENPDGTPYVGDFSPRVPYDVDKYQSKLNEFYDDFYHNMSNDALHHMMQDDDNQVVADLAADMKAGAEIQIRKLSEHVVFKNEKGEFRNIHDQIVRDKNGVPITEMGENHIDKETYDKLVDDIKHFRYIDVTSNDFTQDEECYIKQNLRKSMDSMLFDENSESLYKQQRDSLYMYMASDCISLESMQSMEQSSMGYAVHQAYEQCCNSFIEQAKAQAIKAFQENTKTGNSRYQDFENRFFGTAVGSFINGNDTHENSGCEIGM